MKRSIKKLKPAQDLDLMPIMNLFSILIPFLLSMAVFQKMAIVEVFMEQQQESSATPQDPVDNQELNLTLTITDDSFQIWSRAGALPAIFTKEIVEVRCKTDQAAHRHDRSDGKSISCENGEKATMFDYERFLMVSLDKKSEKDPGTPKYTFRNANDSALMNSEREFLEGTASPQVGKVYRTLDEENTFRLAAKDFNQMQKDYLTAYDELSLVLQNIQSKFVDLPDAEEIIILSDDKLEFDKIIHAMDVAKAAGFHKIQLAKLGA